MLDICYKLLYHILKQMKTQSVELVSRVKFVALTVSIVVQSWIMAAVGKQDLH